MACEVNTALAGQSLSREQAEKLALDKNPLISIVVPVYRISPVWLGRCVESVLQQYYANWQLVLVDDGSQDASLTDLMRSYAAQDSRVTLVSLPENQGISIATNKGIEAAAGDFIGFLDHDDELTPDALTWVVAAHNRNPEAVWFYSDEELVDTEGNASNPFFKPDFSPEYLLGVMYTCHFSVYASSLLSRVGGLRAGFEGSQDHDLALRLSELVSRERVVHIPRVLYRWRTVPTSTCANLDAKPYAETAGRRAVTEALARRGIRADIQSSPFCRTHYQLLLSPCAMPKVAIIIPTFNALEDLRTCIESVRKHTRYENYEIVVIDNRSTDPDLLSYLEQESAGGKLVVRKYPLPFNHSEMNNQAVEATDAEFVVFMNNDIEILSDHWLETMVATAQLDPSIAGVGALLLYPDGTIQHAGVILGAVNCTEKSFPPADGISSVSGTAGHALRYLPADHPGYFGRAQVLHEVSAATAALLLMRRSAFLAVAGFNAQRYPDEYNDVDLWLRLRTAGFRCLFNPLVRATHFESKTRRSTRSTVNYAERLMHDWAPQLSRDPFYNPNLALNEHFQGRRPYPVVADFPELVDGDTKTSEQPGSATAQETPNAVAPPPVVRSRTSSPVACSRFSRTVQLAKRFGDHCRSDGVLSAFQKAACYVGRRLPKPASATIPHDQAPVGRFDEREVLTRICDISLKSFLSTGQRLCLPTSSAPKVSIVLVLFNRAELTFSCLNSIAANASVDCEIILVDNASSDATSQLLERIDGATIVRNDANIGFGEAVNQAARQARGKYVLLLNNDTQLIGNSIANAVSALEADESIGAVGARIILLDGTLQEAGSIIWRDGTAQGYGRGDSPDAPPYMFARDVDFCSGAFLLTPLKLFLRHGGFDKRFSPAYYEDVDYCVQLWRDGWRVVYRPDVVVLHYESASSASSQTAQQLMQQKRAAFVEKHSGWLARKHVTGEVISARTLHGARQRILVIDQLAPRNALGAGYPRATRLLHGLCELGMSVTLYPLYGANETWADIYGELPQSIEVLLGYGVPRLRDFLVERRGQFDLVLISRPTCMRVIKKLLQECPEACLDTKIVYDAEALFCLREAKEFELQGKPLSTDDLNGRIEQEVRLADGCFSIVSVNRIEAEHFQRHGCPRVHVLSHAVDPMPGSRTFHEREGLLFVGPIHNASTPNADSVRWLLEDIVPRMRSRSPKQPILTLAGMWCENALPAGIDCSAARILGCVPDLQEVYNQARAFVAPTRFSAGIPLKIYEAAAHGVPVIATSLAARQLDWRHERELLVADSPEQFAHQCDRLLTDADLWEQLRERALAAIKDQCSRQAFTRVLRNIVDEALPTSSPSKSLAAKCSRAA